MSMKHFTKLLLMVLPVGLITLAFFTMEAMTASLNGGVCNDSSSNIWLTLTESSKQKVYSLPPGHCTNVFTQDVEAIWGRDCSADPCKYQAWKLGAGHFKVDNYGASSPGSILLIRGWGAGSRWRIAPTWPRPDLASVTYSLAR
jgi:hypothetical protein